jgi:predicted ABC-type exoprotein transport system permease subunit
MGGGRIGDIRWYLSFLLSLVSISCKFKRYYQRSIYRSRNICGLRIDQFPIDQLCLIFTQVGSVRSSCVHR